jgi:hypothetical protein
LPIFRIHSLDEALQVSLITVVHEKVQVVCGSEGPVKLNDILVRHLVLHNIDLLTLHFLFVFVQTDDLASHDLVVLTGQSDFPKAPNPDFLVQKVVSHGFYRCT